jgi:hypothetical protein
VARGSRALGLLTLIGVIVAVSAAPTASAAPPSGEVEAHPPLPLPDAEELIAVVAEHDIDVLGPPVSL